MKYDAESRIRVLDLQLFPEFLDQIEGARNPEVEEWYVQKMFSLTDIMLSLPDCEEEQMREVFNRHMKRLIEILKAKYIRRIL